MRTEIINRIENSGVVAVIRLNSSEKVMEIISALSDGGVQAMEITMTTPDAIDMIKLVAKKKPEGFVLGVGTVLDPETARAAILAGAEFVVSPVLNQDVIRMSHRYDIAVLPGAFTPTEILTAWEHGADLVKVFPATALGPKFFKDVRGPLPQVKLTPTGGVSLDNATDFIRAGASCLGVGTAMLDKKMIAESNWKELSKLAAQFITAVQVGRS